jgi:hypothetical protein
LLPSKKAINPYSKYRWELRQSNHPVYSINSQAANHFEHLNNGITTLLSQVYIKRNYFRDIRAYQPSTLSQSSTNTDGFTRGAAIYIYNYNYGLADRFVSVVTNDSIPGHTGSDTTFVNCDNGIAQQLFDSLSIQDPGVMGSFEDTLQLLYDSATLNHVTGILYSDLVGRSFDRLRYLGNAAQSENFRSINGIYLSTVAVGIDTFTSTQLDTINSLSSQCPYEAGDAVYIARQFL